MQRTTFDLANGTLSALRFGDPKTPLKLIFCHANGFNAQTYRAVLAPLGVHALAIDLRGHGLTNLPTDPEKLAGWQVFANDLAKFFDNYIETPVVLAGHSYGATTGILATSQVRDKVAGYVGFDPVLIPGFLRVMAHTSLWRRHTKRHLPIARKAGQRKSVFDDLETAMARYQGRGAFRGVPDDILRDYLEGGLVPTKDGQVRLACDPAWEQAIFAAQSHNAFRNISILPDESRLVFAGSYGRVSTLASRRAIQRRQRQISVEYQEGFTHLFPLQETGFATEVLRDVLIRTGLMQKS